MIIFVLYAKIHTHRVIERNEFSSRIDVDHDNVQNETCHRYWWFKVIKKNRRFQFARCYALISKRRIEFDKHFEFKCQVRFFTIDFYDRLTLNKYEYLIKKTTKITRNWRLWWVIIKRKTRILMKSLFRKWTTRMKTKKKRKTNKLND